MGVAWIDGIANNTSDEWYIQSIDSGHNGAIKSGGNRFTLDDKKYHPLSPRTVYRADWCGIPWYTPGPGSDHFKSISLNQQKEVHFFTSFIDGKNWIIYYDPSNLRIAGRQEIPVNGDCRCNLRIEDSGIFIDVVNGDSTGFLISQINDEAKSWLTVLAPELAALVSGLLKS